MLYEVAERIYELERQGRKIAKLNIGEPDWRPPESVMQAVSSAIKEERDKYASAAGEAELRQAIAGLHGCDTKKVVVVPGSKWGIYALLKTLLGQGDNAIIFSPHWTAYELMCSEVKAESRLVKLGMENDFAMDFDALNKAIDSKTKAVILNSPCNPTSHAWSEREEKEIIEFAESKGITVIADDAYRDLCFDKRRERSFGDNLFIANTFSKTFGMTGWRVGYVIVPEDVAKKIVALNQITITNVPVFLQLAALKALEQKKEVAEKARELCKERAELASRALGGRLEFSEPNAGFYLFPKLPQGIDAMHYISRLLDKGVAVVPGAAFGEYKEHFRVSLAAEKELLRQALNTMIEVVEECR